MVNYTLELVPRGHQDSREFGDVSTKTTVVTDLSVNGFSCLDPGRMSERVVTNYLNQRGREETKEVPVMRDIQRKRRLPEEDFRFTTSRSPDLETVRGIRSE